MLEQYITNVSDSLKEKAAEVVQNNTELVIHKLFEMLTYGIWKSCESLIILIKSGQLNEYLIAASMVGIILWQLGARFHVKYFYWFWVFFFGVRWLCR